MPNANAATVTVYAPCDCDVCRRGGLWFQCRKPIILAKYDCEDAEGEYGRGVPSGRALAEITKRHPGADLRYFGGAS